MTEPQFSQAQEFIRLAYQALRTNNREQAYQYAVQAAELDPHVEDPWLILGAISEPKAAVGYLKRALDINPSSSRARKGMQWAIQRLRSAPDQPAVPTTRCAGRPAAEPDRRSADCWTDCAGCGASCSGFGNRGRCAASCQTGAAGVVKLGSRASGGRDFSQRSLVCLANDRRCARPKPECHAPGRHPAKTDAHTDVYPDLYTHVYPDGYIYPNSNFYQYAHCHADFHTYLYQHKYCDSD